MVPDISHHKQTTHFRSSNDLQSKYMILENVFAV